MSKKVKSLGLALGGGGLKGFAHIGILQVLEQRGIPINFIAGTSVGSIIAALYASGISPFHMETLALRLQPGDYLDYNYWGMLKHLFGLLKSGYESPLEGIFKGDKIEQLVEKLTRGKTLQDCRLPIAIVACDIDSGQEIIFTNTHIEADQEDLLIIREARLSQAVRASVSIPVTFIPARVYNMQLVDGGIKSMVPVVSLKMMGVPYILAVNLGSPRYRHPVRGIFQIISRSIDILAYETSKTEQQWLADQVIYPQVPAIKLDDLSKVESTIRAGRKAMRHQINLLESGLGIL
ncbi:MAG: patatin-like phospholipase family protein [Syntrophomonadaceae bacterium]|nr:patatin-like phospholipase family protein [Syntrophomonadaceae bacterium]